MCAQEVLGVRTMSLDALLSRVLAAPSGSDADWHAGMLDQLEYNRFWETLTRQECATQYFLALLDRLNAYRVRCWAATAFYPAARAAL